MGPEATIALMTRVVAGVEAQDDADHIPLIVDQNTQVPSRIHALLEGGGADPGPVLVDMARNLQRAGAEALAMPCNTAHHFANDIRHAVDVPFLDMVALSVAAAGAGQGPVGILCSPAVRRVGVFEQVLSDVGRRTLYTGDDARALALVRRIKREGASAAAQAELGALSADLLARGARTQILACTEFSLISQSLAPGVTGIDALDILAREIISFSQFSEHSDGD